MHVHPWLEPILSSNVPIKWGAGRFLDGAALRINQKLLDGGDLFVRKAERTLVVQDELRWVGN